MNPVFTLLSGFCLNHFREKLYLAAKCSALFHQLVINFVTNQKNELKETKKLSRADEICAVHSPE